MRLRHLAFLNSSGPFDFDGTTYESGVTKCMNQIIQERIMVMLQHARFRKEFGTEALQTTLYAINLSPAKPIKLQVLQALWTRKTPKYN